MVTTCCEISCFLKTTAKKLVGDQYIVGPNLKVGGPVSPVPYGCCAYGYGPSLPQPAAVLVQEVSVTSKN